MSQWISVEDSYPIEREDVLVSLPRSKRAKVTYGFSASDGSWVWMISPSPTHWMPLPEPPPPYLPTKPIIWSSTGYGFKSEVCAHIVRHDGLKTLCGRSKGRMTTKYQTFSPKHDCQLCAKKAGLK